MDDLQALTTAKAVVTYLVNRICHRLPSLDREEVSGEAQVVALQAVRAYDGKSAALTSWVYTCVWRFLCRSSQSRKWRDRMKVPYAAVTTPDREEKVNFLESLLRDLSPEAGKVVALVASGKEDKLTLLKALNRDFEWERDEIIKVWREIREALL